MRPLFSICQYKCPNLKFLTPPYFRDMRYFRKVGIHCVIIKCTFLKQIMGLTPILNSFRPNLLVSIFKIFKKNDFLLRFGIFLKIIDFTHIFVLSNPTGQKSIYLQKFGHYRPWKWLILTFNTRRSKWDLKKGMLKKKNGRHIIPNLNNENLCQANRPIFGHFFLGFPNFLRTSLKFWNKCHTCLESSGNED